MKAGDRVDIWVVFICEPRLGHRLSDRWVNVSRTGGECSVVGGWLCSAC
jgi:hypothetical protein